MQLYLFLSVVLYYRLRPPPSPPRLSLRPLTHRETESMPRHIQPFRICAPFQYSFFYVSTINAQKYTFILCIILHIFHISSSNMNFSSLFHSLILNSSHLFRCSVHVKSPHLPFYLDLTHRRLRSLPSAGILRANQERIYEM